ncbi:MAG: sigma-54-dependent Fis family transcriptional regulator, partial [Dechloromonas sp.]|nr:sigma-54-dependent Fis family transcriptional regulator [Dechloromonas sp.]
VVQRALIMAPGQRIEPEHLNLLGQVVAPASIAVTVDEKRGDNMNIKDLEREHILQTLAEVGGSRKLAIERLGISERTLRYKLQQYREEGHYRD